MDPNKLREYLEMQCTRESSGQLISRRSGRPVAALVPVHLYGQMADMDAILELADRYQLIVIEDACQAHGARYFSRKHNLWFTAGSMGRAAAFSFYPERISVRAAKRVQLRQMMVLVSCRRSNDS